MIRVLVVDDSAFARKVVRQVLSTAPDIEVVDIARDGLEALEKIDALKPDVVTLDLVMPHLDGLGVLEALPEEGGPRVVVVSISDADSERGIEALQRGAVDLVAKPTALATDRLYEISAELVGKVRVAAGAHPHVAPTAPLPTVPAAPFAPGVIELVAVGTSTGGPPALTTLLRGLPAGFPAPVVMALHIPAGYTEALARRLDGASALDVVEASDGLVLRPGLAALAPGGVHLKVRREGGQLVVRLDDEPRDADHRPSVDVLFESAAAAAGGKVLGLVLTGMGEDGLAGARAIRAAGGSVLTEAAESCVVYGMPRAVREAGLSNAEAPLERLPEAIAAHLVGSHQRTL